MKQIREKNLLNNEDVKSLFSNIESIHQANTIILSEFEKSNEEAIEISQVFLKYGEALKIYINYVNNYEKSMFTYEKCIKNSKFKNLCNVNNRQIPTFFFKKTKCLIILSK